MFLNIYIDFWYEYMKACCSLMMGRARRGSLAPSVTIHLHFKFNITSITILDNRKTILIHLPC